MKRTGVDKRFVVFLLARPGAVCAAGSFGVLVHDFTSLLVNWHVGTLGRFHLSMYLFCFIWIADLYLFDGERTYMSTHSLLQARKLAYSSMSSQKSLKQTEATLFIL